MATDCQVRCQNRLERFLALCLSMWLTICCKVHFPLDFLPYQTFNPLIYPSIFQPHQCPSMVSLASFSFPDLPCWLWLQRKDARSPDPDEELNFSIMAWRPFPALFAESAKEFISFKHPWNFGQLERFWCSLSSLKSPERVHWSNLPNW